MNNTRRVLGIELLNAAQALEFRRPARSSEKIEYLLSEFRKEVPFVDVDMYLHPLIEKAAAFIDRNPII